MSARRTEVAVVLGVCLAVAAGGAFAKTVAETIAERQAGYKAMGAAFKAVNDELKKDAPSLAVVATSARTINATAKAIPGWFPKGSGPASGVKTRAKAEIWSDWTGFAGSAKALDTESAKLERLARAGDLAGVRGQIRPIGGACKGCHDKFRSE